MKILLIGGGGREHAIAWKLTQDDPALELVAAPGNPGIDTLGRCVPVEVTDPAAVVALAREERPDLVVIGPEAPLAAGVSDALRAAGFPVFGPSRDAAMLETSKRFAKEVMSSAGVPTAGASWHSDATSAKQAVGMRGAPVVVKASGLAAGKGVVVASTVEEAEGAIDLMFRGAFGEAGTEVLIEEFMKGEELSIFALTDGEHFIVLPAAQDHKRLGEGDIGPNTGGMGAYSPVSIATPEVLRQISERIVVPTLAEMRRRGTPFRGVLYVGVMLTADGPKVVEFNCRFGDPEAQVVLPLLAEPLLPALLGASEENGLASVAALRVRNASAVTTVVASPGYPEKPLTGAPIVLPRIDDPHVVIFHAGTRRRDDGALVTAGGRVFAVTAVADRLEAAQGASAEAAQAVDFPDKVLRLDIGWRELARRAGAS